MDEHQWQSLQGQLSSIQAEISNVRAQVGALQNEALSSAPSRGTLEYRIQEMQKKLEKVNIGVFSLRCDKNTYNPSQQSCRINGAPASYDSLF